MFDVRPVTQAGDLDVEKISKVAPVLKIRQKRYFPKSGKKIGDVFYDVRKPNIQEDEINRFKKVIDEEKVQAKREISCVPVSHEDVDNVRSIAVDFKNKDDLFFKKEEKKEFLEKKRYVSEFSPTENFTETDYFEKFTESHKKKRKKRKKSLEFALDQYMPARKISNLSFFPSFAAASFLIIIAIGSACFLGKGLKVKDLTMKNSQKAYASLGAAKESMVKKDFSRASFEFGEAYDNFSGIAEDIDSLGKITIEASKFLPYASKLSSGAHLVQAGKNISQIGEKFSKTLETLEKIKNPSESSGESISLLKIFQDTDKDVKEIAALLEDTQKNLDEVNPDDIPEDQRGKYLELKEKLPEINQSLSEFVADSSIFTDILGGNGPRKYLFLFQNNQEMRATGGFIGTYAMLDIFDGRVRTFFVDGIFNPDGQLKEKVVPPLPVQKMSAAWSLHDSNWFPDFPVSAEKASWFYEKTGGPTVDGVITMTPTVMQKLLEITGPIEMPEYGVTVDKDNFIEKVQYEVEVDYDKELNQPKKILADLEPKILDKILNTSDFASMAKTINVLTESLNEKHILIYSKKYNIQKTLSKRGWTGEVLPSQKDYLSVINTNINGYKTDGVVDEKISHKAEIQPDGSIIDNVIINRRHNGGQAKYDWWNRVNADYMRVYVPKGSKLISVSGQTREVNSSPLDYNALGFKRDPQVKMEEDFMVIDEESGTRIYDDGDKTVFANWAYVSPQETVEIKYTYVLPFKIATDKNSKPADAYSLLVQKQSGSLGSKFSSEITYPNSYKNIWKYPEENVSSENDLPENKSGIKMETDLKTDKFIGVALTKE